MKKTENIAISELSRRKPGNPGRGIFKLPWLLIIFLLVGMPVIEAQQATDYAVQANIIYRFTKYIDWPESKKTGDFIIGMVGDSPLADELKTFIANKTVGNRKIVIRRFSSSADSYNCNILFINEDQSSSLKKIAVRTAGSPILLVSEAEGLATKGSCINFITVGDHLRLEINKNNIEQRRLGIASELLSLATIIK
ncbi:MAG TPA: YfiR family protein [Puia sp.]|jgi:hypothetical protein|nr:YfiR family protein [Puia sp.]